MSESVILCEGYHDRAFWQGWLMHLGCVDPGAPRTGKSERSPVLDDVGIPVTRGQYGFRSRSDAFVRLVPCHGKANVLPQMRARLKRRQKSPELTRLVISVDPDVEVGADDATTGLRKQDVLAMVQSLDPSAHEADGDVAIGETRVSLVRWEADDEPGAGVPSQQTLERLVSAALVAAYPARGEAVQEWLKARPEPPPATVKEYAWSHMAGWYAHSGCERFYSGLWEDASVAKQLEDRLRRSGAWRVAESLAE